MLNSLRKGKNHDIGGCLLMFGAYMMIDETARLLPSALIYFGFMLISKPQTTFCRSAALDSRKNGFHSRSLS